jgi:hypothetical protein
MKAVLLNEETNQTDLLFIVFDHPCLHCAVASYYDTGADAERAAHITVRNPKSGFPSEPAA